MRTLVAVMLWTLAVSGMLAVAVAAARPSKRRVALVAAAVLFLPIGVFGILSVGGIFLAAALVCLVLAVVGRDRISADGSSGV